MKKTTYFMNLFILIFAIGFLPIIVLGTYSYSKSISVVEEAIKKSNEDYISHVKMSMEEKLKYAQNYFTVVAISDNLLRWLDRDVDYKYYFDLKTLQENLMGGTVIDQIIENAYFINIDKDYFVSYKGYGVFSEKPDSDKILKYLNGLKDIRWCYIEKNEPDTTGKFTGIEGMSLIYNIPLQGYNEKYWLVVSLSEYQIDKLMYRLDSTRNMIITDENNKIIFHKDKEEVGNDFSFTSNNEVLTYSKSDYNGWNYYSSYSKSSIYNELKPIAYMVLGICFLLFMSIVVLSLFGSKRMYNPIKDIYNTAQNIIPIDETSDSCYKFKEFAVINIGLSHLVTKNTEMEMKLNYTEYQLYEMFFTELVRGYPTEKEINNKVSFLNLGDRYKYLCVVTAQITSNSFDKADKIPDIHLFSLRHSVLNSEVGKTSFSIVVIKDKLVILRGSNVQLEEFMEEIYTCAQKILSISNSLFFDHILIGISTVFSDFADVKQRYIESVNAILFQEPENKDDICVFRNTPNLSLGKQKYPKQKVRELINSISVKDIDTSHSLLYEIIDVLFAANKTYDELQIELTHLALDISIMLEEFLDNYDDIMPNYIKLQKEIEQSIGNSFEMKQLFDVLLISPIIELFENFKDSSKDDILAKLLDIIHTHYDTNLTIEDCASQLNYHPTYIWKIMRNKLNTNFSEYLANYRHDKAIHLLQNTSMTVADIASKLCFNNPQNFIRSFKKREDCTPGNYRTQYLAKSKTD